MGQNFLIVLLAQNDHVLKTFGRTFAARAPVVPNLRFTQESEPCHTDDACLSELSVGSEENRRAENPFKGGNQSSIFRAAFVHSERLTHFRPAFEADRLTLLSDRKRRQKN